MPIEFGDGVIRIRTDSADMDKSFAQLQQKTGVAMTAVGAAAVGGLGLAVKAAADFETAITNAASLTGKSGEEFDVAKEKMEALAQTLGQTTVFSASEAANAFVLLSQKGFDVASMSVSQLEPILNLATALSTDLTSSTDLVTSTMQGFGLELEDTGRIADVFAKAAASSNLGISELSTGMPIVTSVAKAAGVSLEETAAALGKLSDRGVDASTASTGLRNIFAESIQPSKKFSDTLDAMGLTAEDVSLKNQTLSDMMIKLREAGFDAGDAMEAFGKRSGPIAITLLEVAEEVDNLNGTLQGAGDSAKDIAEKQLQTLQGQLKLLASATEALVIPIGQALIPALTKLVEKVTPIIARMAEWAKANPGLVQTLAMVAGALGSLMLLLGPLLLMAPGLAAMWPAIGAVMTAVTGPIGLVVAAVVALGALIVANWEKIRGAFDALMEKVRPSFDEFKTAMVETGLVIWELVKQIFGAVGDILGIFFDFDAGTTDSFSSILNTIIFVVTQIVWYINGVVSVITDLVKMLRTAAQAVGNFFSSVGGAVGNVLGGIGNLIPGLAKGGVINSPLAIVGEVNGGGGELIAGAQGARVFSNRDTKDILSNLQGGGGNKIQMDFHDTVIHKEADMDMFIQKMTNALHMELGTEGGL